MTDTTEFRPLMLRARSLGRVLLAIYEAEEAPAELLELLDIAEARLERAGYRLGAPLDDTKMQ